MLIVALVLAVIGLAALVAAVVTSNELIAWVCIGASIVGVLLLIVDAVRERSRADADADRDDDTTVIAPVEPVEEYPDEPVTQVHEKVESDPEPESETVAVPTETAGDSEGDPKRD